MSEILAKAVNSVQRSQKAFCRFITANDTNANCSHQAGFYIPKCAAGLMFDTPQIRGENKDKYVSVKWQDDFTTDSRFVYYGKGTRNEYRITRFGRNFPFFEEDNVGDLLIISKQSEGYYEGYVLRHDNDIDDFFAIFGLTSEKTNQLIGVLGAVTPDHRTQEKISGILSLHDDFPSTQKMAAYAREIYNGSHGISEDYVRRNPDTILLGWNDTEYELFRAFEEKIYSAVYKRPFADCQALVNFSNSILNRRKSRAGKSLENHLATIFTAAKLEFEEQVITEEHKKPDFIFPGGEAYHNLLFPAKDLTFLGAKTTCKDRWRQVLNEANRIDVKYLFTLQQGISANQLKEMKDENLKLVVPASYVRYFDRRYHSDIETLSSFIALVDAKQKTRKQFFMPGSE